MDSVDGKTGNCRALRAAVGGRHIRCRFLVLQTPVLGTADGEYRNCLGIRSFLLELHQASMKEPTQCLQGCEVPERTIIRQKCKCDKVAACGIELPFVLF